MNYLELIQNVAVLYGYEKPTTFTQAQNNEYEKIRMEINFALEDIFLNKKFKFREKKSTFNTIADQQAYSLPDGVIKIGGLFIPSIQSSPLEYHNSKNLKDFIPDTTTGKPNKYTTYNNEIWLDPIPEAQYSVTILYDTFNFAITDAAIEKQYLSLETDEPNFSDIHHNIIVYKALMNLFDDDPFKYSIYEKRYKQKLSDLISESSGSSQRHLRFVFSPFNKRII